MTDSEKLDMLLAKIVHMERDIKGIKSTLENETNRKIKAIEEGFLGLSERVNEAIEATSVIKEKQEFQDKNQDIHESKLKAL